MQNPLITIITITYNSEKTLQDTLNSIQKQEYENLEYIIIDGGSKDSTLKICNDYMSIISSITSEKDDGISDAMNKGIIKAKGDIIGIIHSDDMLTNDSLKILSEAWDGEHDVYYGDALVCNIDGEIMHLLKSRENLSRMPYYVDMCHPATFITKKAYEKYGLYDKSYKCAMDTELLIRFYKNEARFKYINKPLAIYRIGGTNMKLRKLTISESRRIMIQYGGSKVKSNYIWMKKKLLDIVKKRFPNLKSPNSRVKQISK